MAHGPLILYNCSCLKAARYYLMNNYQTNENYCNRIATILLMLGAKDETNKKISEIFSSSFLYFLFVSSVFS